MSTDILPEQGGRVSAGCRTILAMAAEPKSKAVRKKARRRKPPEEIDSCLSKGVNKH